MRFSSVLIANRGEIACRIVRACHALGLRAVAVYSDADRDALHVQLADEAVYLGPSDAAQSYLDGRRLIDAARRAGAQAVHPGYGFLAENAVFAQDCRDAGLVFVGPSPENIALMGSKMAAKSAAVAAGVPVVPGYHGQDQSDARLLDEAQAIGVPLLIKASAGGGGRGMRRVGALGDLAGELAAARAEAKAAFGNPQVLLERYVGAGRHIEVQILADGQGNVLHLFERDCSLQRNHQKLIEEAPAPNLAPTIRERLLDSAVRLAKNIGYDSAGTVEFLLDADTGDHYFLEMNTRLQVEHPVTELVTGIDIVAWQLRIAGGEALSFGQNDFTCSGWALEARIAAEDPANDYRPQTGRITYYSAPDLPGLRLDSGVRVGSVVGHHYDSMVAKLIGHAPDREGAIRLLDSGLSRFHIAGPGTNIGFLRDLLSLPDFRNGTHGIASLGAAFPDGWNAPLSDPWRHVEAVLACHLMRVGQAGSDPWITLGAWRVTEPSGRTGASTYWIDGNAIRVEGRAGRHVVTLHEQSVFEVENAVIAGDVLQYEACGMRRDLRIHVDGEKITLADARGCTTLTVRDGDGMFRAARATATDSGNQLTAPMPGLVSEVLVGIGESVTTGQPVMVIEAMKLLQTLSAPCSGKIAAIGFAQGETVEMGAILLSIETEE